MLYRSLSVKWHQIWEYADQRFGSSFFRFFSSPALSSPEIWSFMVQVLLFLAVELSWFVYFRPSFSASLPQSGRSYRIWPRA